MPFYDFRCVQCSLLMPDVLRPYQDRDQLLLCPDCTIPLERVWVVSSAKRAASDDIPGGMWLENYGPSPIKVYSHTERKKLLKVGADGKVRRDKTTGEPYQLAEMVRHVPVPGTNKSPHTVDWQKGSIDAVTLENARVLVSRPGAKGENKGRRDPEDVQNDPTSAAQPPSYLRLFNETRILSHRRKAP